jgi:hypothetical protein
MVCIQLFLIPFVSGQVGNELRPWVGSRYSNCGLSSGIRQIRSDVRTLPDVPNKYDK